jgi:two-component system alkaline phosphatase synthesis response regulator PhoP
MIPKNMVSPGGPASALQPCKTIPLQRILVVDDEPDIRQLNTEVLTESGYKVDVAEDGAVAWQALNTRSYDLLITDNEMPKVSGVELLEKLHDARMPLPVIMVSGTMPTEELQRHLWLDIHTILPKPYTIAELLAKVKEVLCATAGARKRITSFQNYQSQPSVGRLRA